MTLGWCPVNCNCAASASKQIFSSFLVVQVKLKVICCVFYYFIIIRGENNPVFRFYIKRLLDAESGQYIISVNEEHDWIMLH